MVLDNRILDV